MTAAGWPLASSEERLSSTSLPVFARIEAGASRRAIFLGSIG